MKFCLFLYISTNNTRHFAVTLGWGPAAASLLLHPSSAVTHSRVFDQVLKDNTVVHEIGYVLHLS